MVQGSRSGRLRWLLIVVLLLGFVLPTAGVANADNAPAYKLGSGDKVRVTVFNEKELSGDFEVSDQGKVALPLIGAVKIGGLTISEAEALITEKYGKDYLVNPRVTVEVLNYRPFFILGEVKNPGSYPYAGGMMILNAIALAGGYTPRADRGDILIKRANDPKKDEQRVHEDAVVLPGDVIRVPERFF
jgi:polysaccharide export outer membrane protein